MGHDAVLVSRVRHDGVDEGEEESEQDETVRIGLRRRRREFGRRHFPRSRNRETIVLEDLRRGKASSGEDDRDTARYASVSIEPEGDSVGKDSRLTRFQGGQKLRQSKRS